MPGFEVLGIAAVVFTSLIVLLGSCHAGGSGRSGTFLAGDEGWRRGFGRIFARAGDRSQYRPRR